MLPVHRARHVHESLLDNTLVYWANELATGRHRLTNVPLVLATGSVSGIPVKPAPERRSSAT